MCGFIITYNMFYILFKIYFLLLFIQLKPCKHIVFSMFVPYWWLFCIFYWLCLMLLFYYVRLCVAGRYFVLSWWLFTYSCFVVCSVLFLLWLVTLSAWFCELCLYFRYSCLMTASLLCAEFLVTVSGSIMRMTIWRLMTANCIMSAFHLVSKHKTGTSVFINKEKKVVSACGLSNNKQFHDIAWRL
jgi:hypothetical protein